MPRLPLSYVPLDGSVHPYLNGALQKAPAEWAIDTNTNELIFKDALSGDRCEARYAHVGAAPPAPVYVKQGTESFVSPKTWPKGAYTAMETGDALVYHSSNGTSAGTVQTAAGWPGILGCFRTPGDYGTLLIDHQGEGVHYETTMKLSNRPGDNFQSGFLHYGYFNLQGGPAGSNRYEVEYGNTTLRLKKCTPSTVVLATVDLSWLAGRGLWNDGRGSQRNRLTFKHDGNGLIEVTLEGLSHMVAGATSPFTVAETSSVGMAHLVYQDTGTVLRGGLSGYWGLGSNDGAFPEYIAARSFLAA